MVDYFRSDILVRARAKVDVYEKLVELFKRLQNPDAAKELAALLSTNTATKANVIQVLEKNGYRVKTSWFTRRLTLEAGGNIIRIDYGNHHEVRIEGKGFTVAMWPNGSVTHEIVKSPKK